MRGPGCASGDVGAFRRRGNERLDKLVAEADDFVGAHVATDHSVRQTLLEGLVDDAAAIREIRLALGMNSSSAMFRGTLPRSASRTETDRQALRVRKPRLSTRPGRHCRGFA